MEKEKRINLKKLTVEELQSLLQSEQTKVHMTNKMSSDIVSKFTLTEVMDLKKNIANSCSMITKIEREIECRDKDCK